MNALVTVSLLAIVVLYLGLFKAEKALLPVTIIGLLAALVLSVKEWNMNYPPTFSGMMLYDNFAIAFSSLAIIATILILLLSDGYFERIRSHSAECYTLILFALAGILLMVSYHNLSMLFIGVEIMSLSLYVLAGIRKTDPSSNEASLKYFLMGAFSTGFLLFGITLIYGATGSFDIGEIRDILITSAQGKVVSPIFYSGIILMTIGLCFKIGAAPFHFWTPDVYQGSPTLITAFMSTVVKTAGFAAFFRLFSFAFAPVQDFWAPILLTIAAVTLLIGNVTALNQQSFKRMLAYSSISHAGYMLFAIIALEINSVDAIFFYSFAYSLASIIAFGSLMLLQYHTGSESFDSFNGLAKKNPFIALTLTVSMLSLAGIPLTAGFIGKFMMFSGAIEKGHLWLAIIGVINAVIGIVYYFRVIIAMYFKDSDAELTEIQIPAYFKIVLGLSAFATIILGVYPSVIPNIF
jgi:NADH-quinone oxidoreductase subunit N